MAHVGGRVFHVSLGAGVIDSREHSRVDVDAFAQQSQLAKMHKSFTSSFRELIIVMSFFPIDMLSILAVNDFLRNPSLMIIVYLEWSSAAQKIAQSGQMSKSASAGVLDLAE